MDHSTPVTNSVCKSALAVVILATLAGQALANSSGAPARTSGGPFPGETACTRCHLGSDLNSGSGTLELLVASTSPGEYFYTPGGTVSLLVKFSDSDASRVGFQLTARSGDGCGQPGSLAVSSATAGSGVVIRSGSCGEGTDQQVQWATHRLPRTGTSAEFEVSWTTPSESPGPVTLAVAVNGANGDLSTQGDSIYTLEATVYPDVAPSGPPAISDGGVILADLFSQTATGAPGAIASASGTNFTAPWREFSGMLDDTGKLGTVLNGTCVEVNQKRAPLFHLSPEALNFQIPLDAGLGAANVQVIRGCDTTEAVQSSLAAFQIEAVKPVFLLFTDDPPAAAALHLDATLVAPEDSISGRPSRSALPGDIVVLFGTGFGSLTPAVATGELVVEPRSLASTNVRAMLGALEVPAEDILYVGAAPLGVGLNQVTMRIPETAPEGEHAFSLSVDGVQSAAGPKISVGAVVPPMSAAVACAVDLVVQPGESCTHTVSGVEVEFSVNDDGSACVSAASLGFSLCGESSLDLSLVNAEVSKNDDGSWTVVKLP